MPQSEIGREERVWPPARHAWCGGRAIGVFVALLVIATVYAACGPIDRSAPSPAQPAVLSRSRFGHVIQEGVGYGGVRIGMTSEELSRAWGRTVDAHGTGQANNVRVFRLDTGETIVTILKDGKLQSLQFMDSRRPGEPPLRASQDVEMGDLVDRVRTVYGDAEQDNQLFLYYYSEGVAFGRDIDRKAHDPRRVYHILIFQKAPSFRSASVIARSSGAAHEYLEGLDVARFHRRAAGIP
jgi:hypothetical protein